jgi:large subunit ribosomal protein L4
MSIKAKIYDTEAKAIDDIELNSKVFGVKISEALIHQVMVAEMANQRQVLAHTKIRSEVRGGGKKPWKQKGTGRARSGSSRSPIWIGGGVTFGPLKDRNFKKKINKKMNEKALFMAMSDRVSNNNFIAVDKLEMSEFKCQKFNEIINSFEAKVLSKDEIKKSAGKKKRSILIINNANNEETKLSARNLAGVKLINANNINLLDLLKFKFLIMTVDGIKKIEERIKK